MSEIKRILYLLFIITVAGGCTPSIELHSIQIHSVEPSSLEPSEPFVIHGQGFPAKQKAKVYWRGNMYRPGEKTFALDLVLDGYSPNSTTIVIDSTATWIQNFRGLGTFHGSLKVEFPTKAIEGEITGTLEKFHVQIPPQNLHPRHRAKLKRQAQAFLNSLGLEIEGSGDQGIIVGQVYPRSEAELAGIQKGDLLKQIDHIFVDSMLYANASLDQTQAEILFENPSTQKIKRLHYKQQAESSLETTPPFLNGYLITLWCMVLILFSPWKRLFPDVAKSNRPQNVFHFFHWWSAALSFKKPSLGKLIFVLGTPLVCSVFLFFFIAKPEIRVFELSLLTLILITPTSYLMDYLWNFKNHALRKVLLNLSTLASFILGFGFSVLLLYGSLDIQPSMEKENVFLSSWSILKHPSLFILVSVWHLLTHQLFKHRRKLLAIQLLLLSVFSSMLFFGGLQNIFSAQLFNENTPWTTWIMPISVPTFKSYFICFLSWRIFREQPSIRARSLFLLTGIFALLAIVLAWIETSFSIPFGNFWRTIVIACSTIFVLSALAKKFEQKIRKEKTILHWPFL